MNEKGWRVEGERINASLRDELDRAKLERAEKALKVYCDLPQYWAEARRYFEERDK